MKDIRGYEGRYAVTEDGRVWSYPKHTKGRSHNGRFLLPSKNQKGYLRVMLDNRKRYFIHRLVAQHFINNPLLKEQVNHKDRNKLNNHVKNLEWCSNRENSIHWRSFPQPSFMST